MAGLISIPALMEARAARQVAVYGVVDDAKVLGLEGEVTMGAIEIPDEIRSALQMAGQQQILAQQLAWLNNTVFRPFATEPDARAALIAKDDQGLLQTPSRLRGLGARGALCG